MLELVLSVLESCGGGLSSIASFCERIGVKRTLEPGGVGHPLASLDGLGFVVRFDAHLGLTTSELLIGGGLPGLVLPLDLGGAPVGGQLSVHALLLEAVRVDLTSYLGFALALVSVGGGPSGPRRGLALGLLERSLFRQIAAAKQASDGLLRLAGEPLEGTC